MNTAFRNNSSNQPKCFFVFDLDETIGHFTTIFHFVFALQFYKIRHYTKPFKERFINDLQRIYFKFVQLIADAESSDTPIGIFRPGILDIMAKIADYKDKNLVGGVIIFSNNGQLRILEFARDVIHAALGRNDLICDCVHLTDNRRSKSPSKYFSDVQSILQSGSCNVQIPPNPKNVMFFDDVKHYNMLTEIGKDNYIQIEPYDYNAPVDKIIPIFYNAISNEIILIHEIINKHWIKHVLRDNYINNSTISPINQLFNYIKNDEITHFFPNTLTPIKNEPYIESILQRMDDFIDRCLTTPVSTNTINSLSTSTTLNKTTTYEGGRKSYRAIYSARKRLKAKWSRKQKTRKYNRKQ